MSEEDQEQGRGGMGCVFEMSLPSFLLHTAERLHSFLFCRPVVAWTPAEPSREERRCQHRPGSEELSFDTGETSRRMDPIVEGRTGRGEKEGLVEERLLEAGVLEEGMLEREEEVWKGEADVLQPSEDQTQLWGRRTAVSADGGVH